MKTLMLVGALILSGLGLAGNAAADCQGSAVGLFEYDNLEVCVLETYSHGYPPYYQYDEFTPLSLSFDGYNPNPYEEAGLGLYASQYTGEQCWSDPCEPYGGTYAELYFYRYTPGDYDYNSVYFGQYHYAGNFYDASTTTAGVSYGSNDEYGNLYFDQSTFNGDCQEQLALDDSSGYNPILGPQPCTVEVPQVPELPAL